MTAGMTTTNLTMPKKPKSKWKLWVRLGQNPWHLVRHEIADNYHFACGSFLAKDLAELALGKQPTYDRCPRCLKRRVRGKA